METRTCQNCGANFAIAPEDFEFYSRIHVPPPTWCPECRMIRRFLWRNERHLFRRKDEATGKEIFSGLPPLAPVKTYELNFWNSDGWNPMEYGCDFDPARPFLEQLRDLMSAVPLPALTILRAVNSDYCNYGSDLRNAYLCFDGIGIENSAYIVSFMEVKESFDLFEARHTDLSYDSYMVDEAYKVFFSANCEESTDIWFSRNLVGCQNCFGCVNLRNKSYYIFNRPYSKEDYKEYLEKLNLGSYGSLRELKDKAIAFWKKYPMRFTLAIKVTNSTGEHIERSKNLKYCYSVHESENLAYSQFIGPPATDSYDYSIWGQGASLMYECLECGDQVGGVKFCWDCWPSSRDMEYCVSCRSSSDLFGCVGVQKKQYCILNKQYSKEDYFALREKIIKHMNERPYISKSQIPSPIQSGTKSQTNPNDQNSKFQTKEIVYRYGEFFPPEFSPFAYNETLAQDFFPLTKEEAGKRGYLWRAPEAREYQTTINAENLPDHIKDTDDSVLKEIIKCISCGKAYRIIPMELEFLTRMSLPLPRFCPNCRFLERFKFVNPPKFWHAKCQCAGAADDRGIYQNTASHFHGENHCPNEFETSYAPDRPEIVYCEACYQSEVV